MEVIKFEVPGKPEYIQMVRLSIGAIASVMGFDIEKIDDIKTALEEACKTISCHGYEGFSDKYEVKCLISDDNLTIDITDFCNLDNFGLSNCDNCHQENSIGFYLMKSLVDDISLEKTESGRKKIRMVKNK
ncbi:MAG: ATP-binding protein [Peptostreptococcaceae bacterium]|nr:ATP-binding protein [Peptostreptococcaceae bacterium]